MKKQETIKIVVTAEQQFNTQKPRFNGFQTGHGAFKSKKVYSRKNKHRYAKEG